jgi:hypothetical protein
MKTGLSYLFIIFLGFGFQTNNSNATKWVIITGCSLKVDGSTNVNNFSCAITNYSRPDTIFVTRLPNQPVKLNGNISLDVQSFDCHNPVMTADLRKTLNAKEHPRLIIRFISINKYPEPGKQGVTKGIVVIELAGVSKGFEVDYKIIPTERTSISLVGSRNVNFSDFDITPPRKLGGMIRTNNELSVVFNLRMKEID